MYCAVLNCIQSTYWERYGRCMRHLPFSWRHWFDDVSDDGPRDWSIACQQAAAKPLIDIGRAVYSIVMLQRCQYWLCQAFTPLIGPILIGLMACNKAKGAVTRCDITAVYLFAQGRREVGVTHGSKRIRRSSIEAVNMTVARSFRWEVRAAFATAWKGVRAWALEYKNRKIRLYFF